jgi:predicted methyltransferase
MANEAINQRLTMNCQETKTKSKAINGECLSLSPLPGLFEETKTESQIIHGDCLSALKTYPQAKFDLIVTSPPYADQRKNTYH